MSGFTEVVSPARRARGLRYYGVSLPAATDHGKPRVSWFKSGDYGGFYVHGQQTLTEPGASVALENRVLWVLANAIGNERLDAVSGVGSNPDRRKLWAHFSVGALGARGSWGDQLLALMVARRPTLLATLAVQSQHKLRDDVGTPLHGLPLVSFPRNAKWTAEWLGRVFRSFKKEELLLVQLEHQRLLMQTAPLPLASLGYSSAERQAMLTVAFGAWCIGLHPDQRAERESTCTNGFGILHQLWEEAQTSKRWVLDLQALERLSACAEQAFSVQLPRGKL